MPTNHGFNHTDGRKIQKSQHRTQTPNGMILFYWKNTNKQWFPFVSKWSEMDFVHPQYHKPDVMERWSPYEARRNRSLKPTQLTYGLLWSSVYPSLWLTRQMGSNQLERTADLKPTAPAPPLGATRALCRPDERRKRGCEGTKGALPPFGGSAVEGWGGGRRKG